MDSKQFANNVRVLLASASMPAARENAVALGAIHSTLDGLSRGDLVIGKMPQTGSASNGDGGKSPIVDESGLAVGEAGTPR